jgi:hypothetical protein
VESLDTKKTKYFVRIPTGTYSLYPVAWKTRGTKWRGFGGAGTPRTLVHYFLNHTKVALDGLRPCRGQEDQFFCGEVTITRPITRMGVYLRKRRMAPERLT